MENVNNSKVFDGLKDEARSIHETTASLEDSIECAISDVDLHTQMRKLKVSCLVLMLSFLQNYSSS